MSHWARVTGLGSALAPRTGVAPDQEAGGIEGVPPVKPPGEPWEAQRRQERLRAAVAGVLEALVRRLDEALPQALASAAQAWDRVDHLLTFFDPALTAHVADVRGRLEAAAAGAIDGGGSRQSAGGSLTPSVPRAAVEPSAAATAAVALEGLMVLEAACGLARVCERRLSSLIRLRVRSGDGDLLPGGRPFLDLAAALKEAARAWA